MVQWTSYLKVPGLPNIKVLPSFFLSIRMSENLTKTFTLTSNDGKHSRTSSTATNVPPFKPTSQTYASFASLCIIVLTEALDATSISVVLPVSSPWQKNYVIDLLMSNKSIAESIGSSTTETFSLGTSFLLASVIFQPIYASLSYVLGRKSVLLAALVLFLIGAIIAGAAKNIAIILTGRIIQGIGAAGPIALTVIVLTDIIPLRQRSQWVGGLNAMWALGSVTGPIIGGSFTKVSWVCSLLNVDMLIRECSTDCIAMDLLDQHSSGLY
jgi:hypothetical protein